MPSAGTQSINLVATHKDYGLIFRPIESKNPLKYVAYGLRESNARDVYESAFDIPDLGNAKTGISVAEQAYLVMPKKAPLIVTPIPQIHGGTLYEVDSQVHPGCFLFSPGGVFGGNTLITGTIYSANRDVEASRIIGEFRREIKKEFKRVEEFWFGPEALSLFKDGMRATQDVRSVPELDIH